MLQFLRNNTKILVWVFVIIFGLLFGLSSISLRKSDQFAGEVFGKKISFQEFRAFETMTRLIPPSPKINEDPHIALQFTWQQVILAHEAQLQKVKISDDEVRSKIDHLFNAQANRTISPDEYQGILKGWRTTPHEFENGIRESLRIQKMISQKFKPETASMQTTEVAGDKKAAADKAEKEKQKKITEYMIWINSIYQRAKPIDYSKQNQKTPTA